MFLKVGVFVKLSELLKIYEQDYDYHIDFLVLPQGQYKGNFTLGYCTEAYMRDLYVIEYLVNHFDLYSIFAKEKDEFILQDSIGSVNIEKANITVLKLGLYKMGLNFLRGNKMLRNVYSLYKENPINVIEQNILNSWKRVIKGCCGNSSICGEKYRSGDVIVGGFRPIHYTDIQETYPNVVKDLMSIENPILRGILLHYVTAYYHPFCDGNGRLSRYLMRNEFAKMNKGLEFLPLSFYLYKDVSEYYSLFPKVINSLTNDSFISYFFKLVKYILINELIEKGLIEIDEKYRGAFEFIKNEKKVAIANLSYIEEVENIELSKGLKEMQKIGIVLENSYYFYYIKGCKYK